MGPRTASPSEAKVGDILIYESSLSKGLFVVRGVSHTHVTGIVELLDGDTVDVHFDRSTGAAIDGSSFIRSAYTGEIQDILDRFMKRIEPLES